MKVLVPLAAIAVLTLSLPAVSFAQTSSSQNTTSIQKKDPSKVTAGQKRQTVTELSRMLRARYCVASTGEKTAAYIEQKLGSGGYDKFVDSETFAQEILSDLRELTKDKHVWFAVAAPPTTTPSGTPVSAEAERAARTLAIRRTNNGLARADVLVGNVGYLEVRRFQAPDLAGDTIQAAVQFLANTDAIIVDVRNCHGGSPFVMPIFAGYFVVRPTHLFDMEFRGDNYTDHYWTAAWLPGKRLAEVPMYILTSAYTFSGAEGFAYRFQVLKRATIVGETTGGGANAGGVLNVAPFFQIWMPMGRPVDQTTSSNWEGTGVVPDIRTSARKALATAHLEALKALAKKASTDKDKADVEWALLRAKAQYDPPALTPQELNQLAGSYEKSRVWIEGGQLRFQRENESPYLMVPVTHSIFASETNDPVRLEFLSQPGREPEKIAFTEEDGTVHELARIR